MNQSQPVVKGAIAAAATTLVTALLGMLVTLGIDISQETQAAILSALAAVIAVVGAAAPLVAAFLARNKVTPLANPMDAHGNYLVAEKFSHVAAVDPDSIEH